jgi:small-conductance mechanosensitive channel
MEIDRVFRVEGIEIAFPQRDLHVRSLPAPRSEVDPTGGG